MNGRERGELLRQEIFAAYEQRDKGRRPNRLRPSEAGHECMRYLWYRFRWADEFEHFEGRMLRLFDTGHSQEDRMIADLRAVGATVYAKDPDNPTEQIAMTILSGHSKGYLDGVAQDVPHSVHEWALVECKSHNEKSFKKLVKDGAAASKPQHHAQMQLYMHEHDLDEGLYIAVNKNDDDLYCEFIARNDVFAKRLIAKMERVVTQDYAPEKINKNPAYFTCKWCPAQNICHHGELPPATCRTCVNSEPATEAHHGQKDAQEAVWYCKLHKRFLGLDDQRTGCDQHEYHPDMVAEREKVSS